MHSMHALCIVRTLLVLILDYSITQYAYAHRVCIRLLILMLVPDWYAFSQFRTLGGGGGGIFDLKQKWVKPFSQKKS